MKCVVGIVDYGLAGNVFSIRNALDAAGANTEIVNNADGFRRVDKLVLPGVGSFKEAMENIDRRGMKNILREQLQRKPLLGICLGMQILSKVGFEFGEAAGLNIIDAEVRPVQCRGTVPHMGFNTVDRVQDCPLLTGVGPADEFYFMHSYEVVNYTDTAALTTYCDHKFVSMVQKDTVFGVQFHPEKSRESGLKVFRNFISL